MTLFLIGLTVGVVIAVAAVAYALSRPDWWMLPW